MIGELILSASSLSAYLSCPKRWEYGHVLRAPEAQNVPAITGVSVHSGVEALHRGKSPESARKAVRASFAAEAASVPSADLAADTEALGDALKMLAVYEAKVLPTFHPDLVEQEFTIRLHGTIIHGTIDSADTKTDEVHDLKTSGSARFKPAGYDLQLSLYAAGYFSITGRWPRRLVLDVIFRNGRYRPYERKPDFHQVRDAIEVVSAGIMRGDFQPDGRLSGACYFCPFRRVCAYAKLD